MNPTSAPENKRPPTPASGGPTHGSKADAIACSLLRIQDVHERLETVMERKPTADFPGDRRRTPERLVPGCTSEVWFFAAMEKGCCRFSCDSGSRMVRGLVSLVCESYDGCRPEVAAEASLEVLTASGLHRHLSPTRLLGLSNVVSLIRAFGGAHLEGAAPSSSCSGASPRDIP